MDLSSSAHHAFAADADGLARALEELVAHHGAAVAEAGTTPLPDGIPADGIGPEAALALLAPLALDTATSLWAPTAAAHMDTPTPWITWAAASWTAAQSQNLLHRRSAPGALALEDTLMSWLAPMWGMHGGHVVPGATIANLTALWAARDGAGASRIVTSEAAHVSIAKSARLLGMPLFTLPTDSQDRISLDALADMTRRNPAEMDRTAVVLTAGTSAAGSIDQFDGARRAVSAFGAHAPWWHIDAAWAGPLVFSERHRKALDGIARADSVSVATHKWLFQPTEAAVVLFRDLTRANSALQFFGPGDANQIGLLGSRADRSLTLVLTLLAYGKAGVGAWIDQCIQQIAALEQAMRTRDDVELFGRPSSGILLWRPTQADVDTVAAGLDPGSASVVYARGQRWIRHVAASPLLDADELLYGIEAALRSSDSEKDADPA